MPEDCFIPFILEAWRGDAKMKRKSTCFFFFSLLHSELIGNLFLPRLLLKQCGVCGVTAY